jgi:hypothetical protein
MLFVYYIDLYVLNIVKFQLCYISPFTIYKIWLLIVFREIISVYSWTHMNHIEVLSQKNNSVL